MALPDKSFYSYHSLIPHSNFPSTWDESHVIVTWVAWKSRKEKGLKSMEHYVTRDNHFWQMSKITKMKILKIEISEMSGNVS